jgi:hypothetical protein
MMNSVARASANSPKKANPMIDAIRGILETIFC